MITPEARDLFFLRLLLPSASVKPVLAVERLTISGRSNAWSLEGRDSTSLCLTGGGL